jgi:tagatose 6-phosphate kinase
VIVTVTLNAALDVTYVTPGGVRPGTTHRIRSVAQRAGGKGVNTARVLASLGEPVLALGLAGGASGAELRAELDAAGVPHGFTPIAGTTRRTVAVVDASGTDGVTGFWEPGPQVTGEEWQGFRADFRVAVRDARAVVLAGSLPPGVPGDAYADLVGMASGAGVPSLVDADGDALRAALSARPALVKPNAEEALRALGEGPANGPHHDGASVHQVPATGEHGCPADGPRASGRGSSPLPLSLARRLVAGGAGSAVVSAGARGLVACWGGRLLAVAPPRVISGNATGAGDAASAALAVALARGLPPEEALSRAVALSAAAVAAPLAGDVDGDVLAELEPLVAVRDLT